MRWLALDLLDHLLVLERRWRVVNLGEYFAQALLDFVATIDHSRLLSHYGSPPTGTYAPAYRHLL